MQKIKRTRWSICRKPNVQDGLYAENQTYKMVYMQTTKHTRWSICRKPNGQDGLYAENQTYKMVYMQKTKRTRWSICRKPNIQDGLYAEDAYEHHTCSATMRPLKPQIPLQLSTLLDN